MNGEKKKTILLVEDQALPAALCIAGLKDYKIIEINATLVKRSGFYAEGAHL